MHIQQLKQQNSYWFHKHLQFKWLTALDRLQYFINHIKNKRKKGGLIFIIDAYQSPMTVYFYKLATGNKTALFGLFFHLRYLIQLLDVGVYQLLKHPHMKEIDKTIRLKNEKWGKLKFFSKFYSFQNMIFNAISISNTFNLTNLVW